ncbi:MAG: cytochrome c4 [Gammaproteobacteria bacterium]|nr:cytochrome c4 [Gammaproteobacteria bacterium]
MKPSRLGAIIIGFCSLISFSLNAASVDAGKAKSAICAGCHGQDGNSVNAVWPKLAGQHASYLSKQLRNFKDGSREDAVMKGMVAALSDADIADISAYFASQAIKGGAFNADLVALGENIYRGGITESSIPACIGCHSPSGDGNGPASFPSLKSQHPEYIVMQLNKFKDGSRSNDSGKMMQNVAKRMLESEMQAVAAYIAGLQ